MRRLLFWLLIAVAIWVLIGRFAEIQKITDTLVQGLWYWIIVAFIMQGLSFFIYARLYQAAFKGVDVESSVHDLLPLMFASIFVSVVAPGGTAASSALFVSDAAKRGQSATRTAMGIILILFADSLALTAIAFLGLAYLFKQHELTSYEVIGVILLLALIGILFGLLLLSYWRPKFMHWLLTRFHRISNKILRPFKKRQWLPDDWVEKTYTEFEIGIQSLRSHPDRVKRMVSLAFLAQITQASVLTVLFLAFRYPVAVSPLLTGYAMGMLFWLVSPIPQGIGVVEGIMTLVFISLGVPSGTAAVVSLAYRGLTLWLPMLLGFILLRRLRAFSNENTAP